MQAANPDYRTVVERGFSEAAFVNDVGIVLQDCGPGWVESSLVLAPRHLQHTGVVHAGVHSTIADHSAGAAAMTLLAVGSYVLTAEFKLNLLRAARGESLWCRAQVLKPGGSIIVVESEVYAVNAGARILCSKLTATLAVLTPKAAS